MKIAIFRYSNLMAIQPRYKQSISGPSFQFHEGGNELQITVMLLGNFGLPNQESSCYMLIDDLIDEQLKYALGDEHC
jgi:hypothetical protein